MVILEGYTILLSMKNIIKKLLLKHTNPKIDGISVDYIAEEIVNAIEDLQEDEESKLWAYEADKAKMQVFEDSRGV